MLGEHKGVKKTIMVVFGEASIKNCCTVKSGDEILLDLKEKNTCVKATVLQHKKFLKVKGNTVHNC